VNVTAFIVRDVREWNSGRPRGEQFWGPWLAPEDSDELGNLEEVDVAFLAAEEFAQTIRNLGRYATIIEVTAPPKVEDLVTSTHSVTVEVNVSADGEEDAVQQVREWLESHPQPQPDVVVRSVT
jgi:hypothetical protein